MCTGHVRGKGAVRAVSGAEEIEDVFVTIAGASGRGGNLSVCRVFLSDCDNT